VIASLRVPPMMLGERTEPATRHARAAEVIAYLEPLGVDPHSFPDVDVQELALERYRDDLLAHLPWWMR
jgi:hypothetical protein